MWSVQNVKDYYSKYAADYENDLDPENYPAPFLIGRWAVEHSRNWSGPVSVLDLGCGTGVRYVSNAYVSSLSFLSLSNFEVVGVDATQEMLDRAARYPFKKLLCMDIEALDISQQFDIIVCVGVLDFISQPREFLTNVAQLLKPDPRSRVGLTFPEGGDMHSYTSLQIQQLLTSAGFTIEKHEKFFGYTDSASNDSVYYHGYLLSRY
jgi:SAM-dependent methyltransferase